MTHLAVTDLLILDSVKPSSRQIEKKILDSIIGDSSYDSRIRPSGVNGSATNNSGWKAAALLSIRVPRPAAASVTSGSLGRAVIGRHLCVSIFQRRQSEKDR